MENLTIRPRRNRKSQWLRDLLAQNNITANDLILPIFVTEGENKKIAIDNFPDQFRFSIDLVVVQAQKAAAVGIKAIMLFPSIEQSLKADDGKEAVNPDNLICRAVKAIKSQVPQIGVICDVALDPYSDHGHDGVLDQSGDVDNDKTVAILTKQALIQAQAGCDIIAPSDMMDGRVKAIRDTLESNKFFDTVILSYAAKYASSFYGPFRDAVGTSKNLGKGSKKTYQMNFANLNEALHETGMDIEEGADIVMVKPGTAYLDVVHAIKSEFQVPTFVYQVSGEYSMLQLSIEKGWLEKDVMLESLMCCKRAGADAILTYAAKQIALELNA